MDIDEVRAQAAAAATRGDFKSAYRVLAEADAAGALPLADLPLFADVAYGAGELSTTFEVWERVHTERLAAGDRMGAAEAAVRVAQHLLIDTALMAPMRAWLVRAEALLDNQEDNPVFAWLAVVRNYEHILGGDFARARVWANRAIEVGTRCEPTAAAIGKVAVARGMILEGHVREGLRLLDEAAAAMVSRDMPAVPAGMIYCELVCGAQGVGHYDLAEEWTAVMERWSGRSAVGSLHGRCRIHRAEILRLRGALADAEAEALGACDELRPYLRREMGWPLVEVGMIRLRRGDLVGAEEAFVEAHQVAWDPHPGLALLRLAQGDVPGAAAAIRDALDHPLSIPSKERPPNSDIGRVPLLEAKVEIDVAAGDHAAAASAADELVRLATRFESKAFAASGALAQGRVSVARGDFTEARRQLESAIGSWNEIGAPYETAVARVVLAAAHAGLGQHDRAALERNAAQSAFERIGAVHHAIAKPTVAPSLPKASMPCSFRRDGDVWLVELDGRAARIRDLKGLHYLARLLAEPGRELHVLDVVGGESGGTTDETTNLGDAGAFLDARAKEMYRRRLADITSDIEAARSMNDLGRVAQAEREHEFLIRELSRAVGLGGRDRTASSASERARAAATRAVRQAIARLREHHPALADHLDRTIRTGTFFAYLPDPRAPIEWTL